MYACGSGSVDIAQMLLKHPDVDVNRKSYVGSFSPICIAFNNKYPGCWTLAGQRLYCADVCLPQKS